MARLFALLIGGLLVVGCSSGPIADPVFVGATSSLVDCPQDGGSTCLEVVSEVDGTRSGTGSCILYASTGLEGGRVSVAASGDLDLVPGTTVKWVVRVPAHLGRWNPVCVPTAEG